MHIDLGEWQLRSWQPGDKGALVKYANNREVWINLRESFPHPYTEKDAEAWIRQARKQNPETQFAIASSVEAIGGIGMFLQQGVYRRSAEVSYWLGEPFWGKGIATKAVGALTEYAFAQFDLARLFATVFEWNPASARVLEKAGYRCEGRLRRAVTKDGKTIDEFLYSITRE